MIKTVKRRHLSGCISLCFILLTGNLNATETEAPADTGLGQNLRQQIDSDCYGFVEHDTGLVRGYEVNEAFQLTRDGYPWARFDDSPDLLIQRQEVLVGGAGMRCGAQTPGGTVNLVTRRHADFPTRTVAEVNEYGYVYAMHERSLAESGAVRWRMAVNGDDGRGHNGDEGSGYGFATQTDVDVAPGRRLRFDLEWHTGDHASGVGWPTAAALPANADRWQSLEQDWSRYNSEQVSMLLAYEADLTEKTSLKFGYSRVRFKGGGDALYLDPDGSPAMPTSYTVFGYRMPQDEYRFDALHAEVGHDYAALGARQRLSFGASYLAVNEPDVLLPTQIYTNWRPGQPLNELQNLSAIAQRRLDSTESRLFMRNDSAWQHWQLNLAGRWTRYQDSNGETENDSAYLSPAVSLSWLPTKNWRVQATHLEGHTGRQFSSLSSLTPYRLNPPGESSEDEIGVHWDQGGWTAGLAFFSARRAYQFEQGTVEIWRGSQEHRGQEATLGWQAPDESSRIVFTGQSLNARITGTGDPALDGKQPPSVPARRATLYGEWKPGAHSPWLLTLLGEYQGRRATLDDNTVFAPGYTRWDAGMQWQGRYENTPVSLLLTVSNLNDQKAWEWVGGGIGYLLVPRTVGLTLVLGGESDR